MLTRARTWLGEGGNPTAVQRLRAPCPERETDVRCGGGNGSRTQAQDRLKAPGGAEEVRFRSILTRSYFLQNLGYSKPRDFCCAVIVVIKYLGKWLAQAESFLPAPSAEVVGLSVFPVILLFQA